MTYNNYKFIIFESEKEFQDYLDDKKVLIEHNKLNHTVNRAIMSDKIESEDRELYKEFIKFYEDDYDSFEEFKEMNKEFIKEEEEDKKIETKIFNITIDRDNRSNAFTIYSEIMKILRIVVLNVQNDFYVSTSFKACINLESTAEQDEHFKIYFVYDKNDELEDEYYNSFNNKINFFNNEIFNFLNKYFFLYEKFMVYNFNSIAGMEFYKSSVNKILNNFCKQNELYKFYL